ncbi:XkdQ/YqbQ family protein [Lysinibacillus sp. NPDC093712]|uniref:XkdQ/YqbQ family protein n=1 Tax=Lysinibacillus sp. NPDC093712 TaxID=3390579 RepID=UPI003D077F07
MVGIEVLVDNRDGNIYEVPVTSLSWKTEKTGKASELNVNLLNPNPLENKIVSGAIVRVIDGKHKVFYGYSFKAGFGKDSEFNIIAYDQLKYLMYEDTFVIPSMLAEKAIERICSIANLQLSSVAKTGFTTPGMVEEDKKALDVIMKCIDSAIVATNQSFVFMDEFGSLGLHNINDLVIPPTDFYIGEESLLYDYNYSVSIEDSYNRVKLVLDDKETSKRRVFIAQDSSNIAKWGQLQYYKKVDENMTPSQIESLLNVLLTVHNTEKKELSLKCLGDWRVRAGKMVFIYIEKLKIKQLFLVEACTHDWSAKVHTMSLELKVIS